MTAAFIVEVEIGRTNALATAICEHSWNIPYRFAGHRSSGNRWRILAIKATVLVRPLRPVSGSLAAYGADC